MTTDVGPTGPPIIASPSNVLAPTENISISYGLICCSPTSGRKLWKRLRQLLAERPCGPTACAMGARRVVLWMKILGVGTNTHPPTPAPGFLLCPPSPPTPTPPFPLHNRSNVTDLAALWQKLRHHFADGKWGNIWPARVIHGLVPFLFTDEVSHSFSKLCSSSGGLLQNVLVRPFLLETARLLEDKQFFLPLSIIPICPFYREGNWKKKGCKHLIVSCFLFPGSV